MLRVSRYALKRSPQSVRSPHPMQTSPCAGCGKKTDLCVCEAVNATDTRLFVLVLQHPQEPKEDLSTAGILKAVLPRTSAVKVGLSWRNLRHALEGTGAPAQDQPKRWAVLFLGTAKSAASLKSGEGGAAAVTLLSRNGNPRPEDVTELTPPLAGIILLDGTWSQAKTLWWRNPWLLKVNRIALLAGRPSLYRNLRKEPRPECLSTLEAAAYTLEALEGRGDPVTPLIEPFKLLLHKRRQRHDAKRQAPAATPQNPHPVAR